jgi:hypothetical protein
MARSLAEGWGICADLCVGSAGALPLPLEGGRGGGARGRSGPSDHIPPGMAGELELLLVARLRGPRGESENGGAVCAGVAGG